MAHQPSTEPPSAAAEENAVAKQSAPIASTDLPVSRWGWPLLQALRHDALQAWASIHQSGDAVQTRIMGRTMHFLFHPTLVRSVLMQDEQAFVKEGGQTAVFKVVQGVNVLTTRGTNWKRQRRILGPAFSARRVSDYMALMMQAARDVNLSLLPQQTGESRVLNVGDYATRVTMDVILRVLFSQRMPPEHVQGVSDSVRQLSMQGMRMLFWPFIPPAWFPYPGRRATVRSQRLLGSLIGAHIAARRRANKALPADASQDLLGVMLASEDETSVDTADALRRLSTQEVEDNCMALFLAGHDTSATAITWWMGLMATHPAAAARARQEVFAALGPTPCDVAMTPAHLMRMPWLEATLKEAMRLRPPITAPFMRKAQQDVAMHGVVIRAGEVVSMPIWQMHHDPRWFPEPEAFRPERFMPGAPEIPRGAWMPFGTGPHVCIGQHFAMVEMTLLAALLLAQVRWAFEPGDDLPAPRLDIVLKPERPMRLRVWRESDSTNCVIRQVSQRAD